MPLAMKRSTRLSLAIGISFSFFIAEISIGFKTRSIALIADAFHYLNDLIGFVVALAAILISEKGKTHKDLTFGWQRATLLGAFFNGVFLLALGVSILLQSLERFINLTHVENPMLVVIIGAIGLGLNIISIAFLHEHDHGHGHEERPGPVPLTVPSTGVMTEPEIAMTSIDVGSDTQLSVIEDKEANHQEHRHIIKKSSEEHDHHHHHDLGMAGVLLHVAGDAINNIGVIVAGLIIWKVKSPGRFYADPAVGIFIALMILLSSLPLVKRSGHILLQSPPTGIDVEDIKHDLEKIPGIVSVHELHVWRLNQEKSLASAHVVIDDVSLERFHAQAKTINECLHAYGVHSATIQPELLRRRTIASRAASSITAFAEGGIDGADGVDESGVPPPACAMNCGTVCEKMTCCG